MATAEAALKARLEAVSGITALVGTRIYPLKLKQVETLPALTYQRISRFQESAMGVDTTVARGRFQVTCFAGTVAAVQGLAMAVTAGLKRFRGSSGGLEVLDVFMENQIDLYDSAESDAGIFAIAQDYTWIHRES